MTAIEPEHSGFDRVVHQLLWLALDARSAHHRTRKNSRPGTYRGRPPAAMNAAAQRFRTPRA